MNKKLLTASTIVTLSIALSGCETLSKKNLTVANEYIAAGIAGAGCAAISLLTGSDNTQAAISAIVCATVGFGVTKKLENDRKQYASNEQFYKAENKRLKAYDAQLSQQIRSSKSSLANTQSKINRLTAKSKISSADQSTLTAINGDIKKQEAKLQRELAIAKDNLSYQKGLNIHMEEADGSVTSQAKRQLAALERSVAELNQLVTSHEQQSASLGAYL